MPVKMEVEKSRESVPTNHYMLKKSDSDYVYLKILVKNSSEKGECRNPVFLKNYLLKCMANSFGEVNGLVPVDILKYDQTLNEVIIRCNSITFQRLASSVILNNSKLNYFRIQKVSYSNPLGLMFSSRDYCHCSKKNKKRKRKLSN
ncbi:unnamed protein product [Nezara viridula]|uniref:Uncharacterized protein n=1 Tax=Nezara viridula TaxID=85310 RepID=A0A9P0H060_NEZVI|nr:unnamed protein product [Nezara viridula]